MSCLVNNKIFELFAFVANDLDYNLANFFFAVGFYLYVCTLPVNNATEVIDNNYYILCYILR